MYAIIRERQKGLFRGRTIGTDKSNGVGPVDFAKIAAAFGLSYVLISDVNELEESLRRVFAGEGAVLCEIIGKPDQIYLNEAYTRTANKRFARRPIEDQSPFLDRELFLSEMIIEPIDQ
jgi:acetolactate synthase-1/2/3 large subunit